MNYLRKILSVSHFENSSQFISKRQIWLKTKSFSYNHLRIGIFIESKEVIMEDTMKTEELYKSSVSLSRYKNKLYVDPQYGLDHHSSTVSYAVFSSEWDIEDVREDYTIKIIHRASGDTISLAFNTLRDKINFVKNIYAAKPIKQIGKGMELENIANSHLKPSEPRSLAGILSKIVPLF